MAKGGGRASSAPIRARGEPSGGARARGPLGGAWQWPLALAAAAIASAPRAASGETFSVTNAQLLFGTRFDDSQFGLATADRRLVTARLEHFSAWKYGNNYLFTDLYFGKFVDESGARTGEEARLYSEWGPRIGLGKLAQRSEPLFGPLKDVLLAGQVNVGIEGFWALLFGVGIDLQLPASAAAGVNVYYRQDAFNNATYQVSPFWEVPIVIAPVRWVFRGFADIVGLGSSGIDVNSQPQLLLDVGTVAGFSPNRLQVGGCHYFHFNAKTRAHSPQAVVRWLF